MWGILLPIDLLQCSRSFCMSLLLSGVAATTLSNGELLSAAAQNECRLNDLGVKSISLIMFLAG